jgi:hypothetical protein
MRRIRPRWSRNRACARACSSSGVGHAHDAERVAVAAQPAVELVDERTRVECIGLLPLWPGEFLRRQHQAFHPEGYELAM